MFSGGKEKDQWYEIGYKENFYQGFTNLILECIDFRACGMVLRARSYL